MRRDAALLDDILQHSDRILEIVSTGGQKRISDPVSQAAILHHLTVIGEAAGRVSAELCARHPEIPWPGIVSQRNRIVHEYFGIDWQLVWKTVTADLPSLRKQIAALLDEFPPE